MDLVTLIPLFRFAIERAQPEWKKGQEGLRRRFIDETSRALGEHHVYVSRWCQEAHGVAIGAVDRGAPTVELSFRSIPRRVGIDGELVEELDVLLTEPPTVVLGDPGAGKTTTLRRLASHVALDADQGPGDDLRSVVVIVCRDERWKDASLYDVLGKKTGVTGKLAAELDNPESRIRGLLEDTNALILIDGLDEVPGGYRSELDRGITDLGRYLTRAKVVVSCRSGSYVVGLDGFDVAEIQPLTRGQIRSAVDGVLGAEASARFYAEIHAPGHPAAELANRPLFLMQMVAIFKRRETIPERPINLCEAIIRLVIQEWDEQRGVRRGSAYAEFGVDDKRRFLADLAYELIRRDLFRFGEMDLADAYVGLAERYALPKSDARAVARELESHTGLLVQSGDMYEFSHLSLQEYLAADSMVRGTGMAHTDWWLQYPEVAAVATALAQDANVWFAELIQQVPGEVGDTRPFHAFLRRLGQERPRFTRSETLGHQLLHLLFRARVQVADYVLQLGEMKQIRGSVADALESYDAITVGSDETRVSRYDSPSSQAPFEALGLSTQVLHSFVHPDHLRQLSKSRSRSRS